MVNPAMFFNLIRNSKPKIIIHFLGSLDLSSSLDVHHLPVKIRPSPPCFSAARNSTEVQVIIQPVQKEVSQGKT